MRITAVEEYGLRCLLNLARKGPGAQMSISEIAGTEGLSTPYASKLLSILRKAGLVQAERGRTGGFSIARKPEQINLYEVLSALGGPLIDPNHCTKFSGQLEQCVHLDFCEVHEVLGGLAGYIQAFLVETNLKEIIDGGPLNFNRQSEDSVVISNSALTGELNKLNENDS
jgi:Rrf2 family protein